MTEPPSRPTSFARPVLTACSRCAGETLGGRDALPGGQRARLESLAEDGAVGVTFVECLDQCERGDVVVARAAPTVRRGSTEVRAVWLERLAGDDLTGELRRWLIAGGPGVVALPPSLARNVIAEDMATDVPAEGVPRLGHETNRGGVGR